MPTVTGAVPQDRKIAHCPFHTLMPAEREIFLARKRLLEYVGFQLRRAVLAKEGQWDPKLLYLSKRGGWPRAQPGGRAGPGRAMREACPAAARVLTGEDSRLSAAGAGTARYPNTKEWSLPLTSPVKISSVWMSLNYKTLRRKLQG